MYRRLALSQGFIFLFMFPLVSIILEAAGFLTRQPFPVPAIIAVYPLGLLGFLGLPMMSWNLRHSLENRIEFGKGAWYGSILLSFASLPAILLSSPSLIGVGLVFVSIGSMWVPLVWVSKEYALVIASKKAVPQRLNPNEGKFGVQERYVSLFLSILLRTPNPLGRDMQATSGLLLLLFFYLAGWALLSFAGGFPYTLLGLLMGTLVILTSYVVFNQKANKQGRQIILDLLSKSETAIQRSSDINLSSESEKSRVSGRGP